LSGVVGRTVDYKTSLHDLASLIDKEDHDIAAAVEAMKSTEDELNAVDKDIEEIERKIGVIQKTIDVR